MIVIWFLVILITFFFFIYLKLIIKRIVLISKVKKTHPDQIVYKRCKFYSVFRPDCKTDMVLKYGQKEYSISILTTPFHRVRYHFSEKYLEIIVGRKGMYIWNPRAPGNNGQMDRIYTLKKYKITYEIDRNIIKYIVIHPVPLEVSTVSGNKAVVVGNNDIVYADTRACGLSYFLNSVIKIDS